MKTEDGVKYITQIDDYKRELLMRVRDRIENSEKFASPGAGFVCYKIKNVLYEENFTDVFKNLFSQQEVVAELFPEFTDMFDGFCWCRDGKNYEIGASRGWWEPSWKEPRIRILDTLLRD